MDSTIIDRRGIDRRRTERGATRMGPFHLSWAALFGGAVFGVGLWILLYTLGLALGLSSVDPQDPGSLRSAGLGTGIWALIAPLIALFFGALVTARVAGVIDRPAGIIHGAVLWGVTTVGGTIVLATVLGSLLGSAVALGGTALETGAQALAPLAPQIARDASPEELQQRGEELQAQAGTALQGAKESAPAAVEKTGKVFWGVFGALALGLISSILGATLGTSRRQRIQANRAQTLVTPHPEPTRA